MDPGNLVILWTSGPAGDIFRLIPIVIILGFFLAILRLAMRWMPS